MPFLSFRSLARSTTPRTQSSRSPHTRLAARLAGALVACASSLASQAEPARAHDEPNTFLSAPSRMAQDATNPVGAPGTFGGAFGNSGSSAPNISGERADAAGSVAALGPLPVDPALIRRVRVGGAVVDEAPKRVGNLDILAPIADKLDSLGASASEVSLKNIPGNPNTPTGEQYFQINLYNRPPIVMAVGRAIAYVNQKEQPLRAAPLVMGDKIWLPLYSLAPLMGASCRLGADGTLSLNPTIQSVELFQVRGTTVLTVKASAPLRQDSVLMGTLDGPPKIYLDFPGFSMGFDASNSINEKVLTGGLAEVSRVRGGLFEKFPDTTRVVLDLKQKVTGLFVPLPDKSLYALQLQSARPVTNRDPSPPPVPIPRDIPTRNGSLQGLTIVVDAGHGGGDNGARGRYSMEKNHTLDIARKLQKQLRDRGATVLMTRDADTTLNLYWRPQFANQRRADLFISVHVNSYRSTSSGTETFYYTGISLPLAREVHAEMIKALGLPDRRVQSARFVVIRDANMPAILTETAFISNPREEALLMQDSFRQKAANAMARGIQNYVDKYLRRASAG